MLRKIIFIILLFQLSFNVFSQSCIEDVYQPVLTQKFMNLGEHILDQSTGLIWQSCAAGQQLINNQCAGESLTFNWLEAFEYAQTLNEQENTQWRLPNVKELASLIDLSCVHPAIDETVFSQTPSGIFWSNTVHAQIDRIWVVNFEKGFNLPQDKTQMSFLRLVQDVPKQ